MENNVLIKQKGPFKLWLDIETSSESGAAFTTTVEVLTLNMSADLPISQAESHVRSALSDFDYLSSHKFWCPQSLIEFKSKEGSKSLKLFGILTLPDGTLRAEMVYQETDEGVKSDVLWINTIPGHITPESYAVIEREPLFGTSFKFKMSDYDLDQKHGFLSWAYEKLYDVRLEHLANRKMKLLNEIAKIDSSIKALSLKC